MYLAKLVSGLPTKSTLRSGLYARALYVRGRVNKTQSVRAADLNIFNSFMFLFLMWPIVSEYMTRMDPPTARTR